MKSTELRIGNKIHQFGIEIFVTGGTLEKLAEIEADGKICIDLTPIPLTEEWLVEFGYIKSGNLRFTAKGIIDLYAYKNNVTCSVNDVEIRLKYVHQLQNLFFALTGTELEVKK